MRQAVMGPSRGLARDDHVPFRAMLAARGRGIGTAWTTLHLQYEREVAELLGIPYEKYTQVALITVGYFTGEDFKPAERLPLAPIVHWEEW